MAHFSASVWKKEILSSHHRVGVPLMTHPGIEMLGSTVLNALKNPEINAKAVKTLADKFPSAAAVTMMDLSIESEAFGAKIRYAKHEVPQIVGRLVDSAEAVQRLKIPTIGDGRISGFLTAAQHAATLVTAKPVWGCLIGPISLAGRLFDVTELLTSLYMEPETIHVLLEKCTQFLIAYAKGYKSVGTDGLVIAEPVAGMLSRELCVEFSSHYVKRIVDAVQDKNFAVILHNCGDTSTLWESMESTGVFGIHLGNKCNIVEALKTVDSHCLVFGNIDPVSILKLGTPETVRRETLKLLEHTAEYPNFILSSGCDVAPGTPLHNLDAMFDAIEIFNS
jgi:uroporphyrinogen decarboxylase